jgi:hypothetical protein
MFIYHHALISGAYSGFGLGAITPLMYVHALVPGSEPFPFQVEAQHTPHSLSLAKYDLFGLVIGLGVYSVNGLGAITPLMDVHLPSRTNIWCLFGFRVGCHHATDVCSYACAWI